jgi:hypothetical protein
MRKVGSAPIFVVEEAHIMILHRQPSLEDPARNSWETIFGPPKVEKEIVGEGRADEPRKSGSWSHGP